MDAAKARKMGRLTVTRRLGEELMINIGGEVIYVKYISRQANQIRLTIEADVDKVKIHRMESKHDYESKEEFKGPKLK